MTPIPKTQVTISFHDPDEWPSLHSGQFANLVFRSPDLQVWRSRMTLADGEREPLHVEFNENGHWVDLKSSQRYRHNLDLDRALRTGSPTFFANVVLPDRLRVELGYPETAELIVRYYLSNERSTR